MSSSTSNKLLLDLLKDTKLMESLKCEIRRKLITNQLHRDTPVTEKNLSTLDLTIHGLIIDFLEAYHYGFSLSVFVPETKVTFTPTSIEDALKTIGAYNINCIRADASTYYRKTHCVIKSVILALEKNFSREYQDKSCETANELIFSQNSNEQSNLDSIKKNFESKLAQMKQELEGEYDKKLENRLEALKCLYQSQLKVENQKVLDTKVREKTTELENIYRIKMKSLHERQQLADECLSRYKNSESTEAYLRRQVNLAEADSLKLQKQNIDKIWSEIQAKQEENKKYFEEKTQEINIEKENLKAKYLIFEEEVNSRVEEQRKTDMLNFQKREKDIEIAIESINNERVNLNNKKEKLFKFRDELDKKSSLLDQVELINYQNLQHQKHDLEEECKILKNELETLSKKLNEIKQNEKKLLIELTDLRAFKDSFDTIQSNYDQNNLSLVHQINILNSELSQLKIENQDLKILNSSQTSHAKILEEAIQKLENKKENSKKVQINNMPDFDQEIKEQINAGGDKKWKNKLDSIRNSVHNLDKESHDLESNFKSWRNILEVDRADDNHLQNITSMFADQSKNIQLSKFNLPLESHLGTGPSFNIKNKRRIIPEPPNHSSTSLHNEDNIDIGDRIQPTEVEILSMEEKVKSFSKETTGQSDEVRSCQSSDSTKPESIKSLDDISPTPDIDNNNERQPINFSRFLNNNVGDTDTNESLKKSIDIKLDIGRESYSDDDSQVNEEKSDSFW